MAYFMSERYKCRRFKWIFALAVMLVMLTAAMGLAGDGADGGTTIRSIPSMEGMESPQIQVSAGAYFDLVGILNKVDGSQIIIGNTEVSLANGVSASGLNLYNVVGAKLNSSGNVVVLELISNDPT